MKLSVGNFINSLVPQNYNSKALVEMWKDFIDWDKRRKGEGDFFLKQFKKHNVKKVFDSSLGDGVDSIHLIKKGFDVTSNEIDETFLNKALENAKRDGVNLKVTKLDWRKLDEKNVENSFGAVICLGNSLTYIFDEKDQLKTISQFKRILKPGGILVIDERNYQYILDNREEILKGNFKYSGKYVYCGEFVHGRPIEISDKKVKFEYTDERDGKKGYLVLYPFKRGELSSLLVRSGFNSVEQFSDYKPGFNPEADFYQYVCVK